MLESIRDHIKHHLKDWNTSPQVSCPELWKPIFRSNLNYNFVEEYPLITRIIFWVDKGHPLLVTKILDKTLSRESMDDCLAYQQNLNKQLGYDLFPPLYDIADINGHWVLFEPAMQKSTYETELKRAIFTPAASRAYVERVITRQFAEMGKLFNALLKIASPNSSLWGQIFSDLGFKLKTILGDDVISSEQLETMKQNIDSIPIYDTPVIADLACQNIFPGPQLIDNLIPDIKGRNESLPGVINAFRFMVPIFYCPPLNNILKNWVNALEGTVIDTGEQTFLARPVRDLCRSVGLNPDNFDVIWAFIMGTTFFEMVNALDFYKNCLFMDLKAEYTGWISDLVAVQERFKYLSKKENI